MGCNSDLNRSFSKGLMSQVAYTYSKAIDNADFTGGIYGFVPEHARFKRRARTAPTSTATHNFIASYVWDIPFLKNSNDLLSKGVGGWQYSGVVTLRTGLPINPILGRDIAGVGSQPVSGRSPRCRRCLTARRVT